jgi:hypothetical protein
VKFGEVVTDEVERLRFRPGIQILLISGSPTLQASKVFKLVRLALDKVLLELILNDVSFDTSRDFGAVCLPEADQLVC